MQCINVAPTACARPFALGICYEFMLQLMIGRCNCLAKYNTNCLRDNFIIDDIALFSE